MMNLEKMKQKKRIITKSRVKKSLLAATTFLCLTTPLLQAQTAYAAENTTPAITIEKPDGWKQGETTITVTVDASHMPEGFSIAKIEAKAGKDGSWQDVTGSGSISITGNQTVYVRVTDGEGKVYEQNRSIKCYDTEKPTLSASLTDGVLTIQGNDTVSGIATVTVNGTTYTDSFMGTYAQNQIEKKYQRDIGYSLLNGLLMGDELSKVARMLKLKDTAQYCVVSFHTISSNSEDYYTKEELEEIGVIEGEIQRLLPDEHIYRNLNQIVCIHEIKPGETQAGFREEMEKLYQTVQKQIFHRNKTTDFQIGIGSIVNGYGDLKKSFKDSKKIIDYMDMIRYLYDDKNISVADFSKLGFFQIFEKIKSRDELMEYVPESLVKLYRHDKEHDGELIETLQAYLDCDKSANKAAEKLYVNYRTLSSRLKKIKDISGIDFKNSAEMLAVRNGIVLFKMAETL